MPTAADAHMPLTRKSTGGEMLASPLQPSNSSSARKPTAGERLWKKEAVSSFTGEGSWQTKSSSAGVVSSGGSVWGSAVKEYNVDELRAAGPRSTYPTLRRGSGAAPPAEPNLAFFEARGVDVVRVPDKSIQMPQLGRKKSNFLGSRKRSPGTTSNRRRLTESSLSSSGSSSERASPALDGSGKLLRQLGRRKSAVLTASSRSSSGSSTPESPPLPQPPVRKGSGGTRERSSRLTASSRDDSESELAPRPPSRSGSGVAGVMRDWAGGAPAGGVVRLLLEQKATALAGAAGVVRDWAAGSIQHNPAAAAPALGRLIPADEWNAAGHEERLALQSGDTVHSVTTPGGRQLFVKSTTADATEGSSLQPVVPDEWRQETVRSHHRPPPQFSTKGLRKATQLHTNPPVAPLGPLFRAYESSEIERRAHAARTLYRTILASGKRPLARAKLMVVGSGYAGKTSLINRLVGRPFVEGEASTCGIAVEEMAWSPEGGPATEIDYEQAMVAAMVSKLREQELLKEEEAEGAEGGGGGGAAVAERKKKQKKKKSRVDSAGGEDGDEEEKKSAPPATAELPLDVAEMERLSSAAGKEGADSSEKHTICPAPTLTVLDFAGQRMYYQMHHVFITAALSIYVAVFDLAHDPHEALGGEDAECGATRLENLHFWLNGIHAQAPETPIFVIGTHAQSIDADTLCARKDEIEASFEGQAFDNQICANSEIVCVDNKLDSSADFDALRQLLAQELHDVLSHFNIEIGGENFGGDVPMRWLKCLNKLHSLSGTAGRSTRRTLDEVRYVARACGFDASPLSYGGIAARSDAELLLFLRVFTNAGLLMHFDEPGLRELVVLKPQWLLDSMRDVLCARSIETRRKAARGKAKTALLALRDYGVLDRAKVLPLIWPTMPAAQRDSLIAYMVRFDLCCPLLGDSQLAAVPALFPPFAPGAKSSSSSSSSRRCRGSSARKRRGWVKRDDDLIAYFCCSHRARTEEGEEEEEAAAALEEDGGSAARDAFEEECRYLPRALFHTLVARLLGAGTTGTRAAFARLHSTRAVLQCAGRWIMLELRPRACEVALTLRAARDASPSVPAAAGDRAAGDLRHGAQVSAGRVLARLVSDSGAVWPLLCEKYGVQMRVEIEQTNDGEGGGEEDEEGADEGVWRIDLATGRFVMTRERAPEDICFAWHANGDDDITAVAAAVAQEDDSEVGSSSAPAAELDFDAVLRGGSSGEPLRWNFFLSHKQANGGDQMAALHLLLEREGCTSWYDNQMADLTADGMARGVRDSDAFLLFLTKGGTYVRTSIQQHIKIPVCFHICLTVWPCMLPSVSLSLSLSLLQPSRGRTSFTNS